jgi:hypothetical protein
MSIHKSRWLLKTEPIFWLLGEECKPIIIRDANKAFHFAFPETLARLSFGGLARLGRGLPAAGMAY